MGGYNAGEVASGMASERVKVELGQRLKPLGASPVDAEIKSELLDAVDSANREVYEAAMSHAEYAGMGTTLVVAVYRGDRLWLGHIGDSRCYRLREGEFVQITKDHSLLQEQMDAGLITPEQAATSSNKNLVTRALGVEDAVLLEVNEHKVEPGDIYLMCSDGLSDMVDDEGIAKILATDAPLEQKVAQLIDAANANGGRDNISVLLAQANTESKKRGLISRLLGK
jgi:protein phosphatase